MQIIDAHQHFWIFDAEQDSWINLDMEKIRRDFLPDELSAILKEKQINGCVAVQSRQNEEDNFFLLECAQKNAFVKGIVGWIDLCSDRVEADLKKYSRYPLIKGFRHVLEAEKDLAFMLKSSFLKGISLLHAYGFTYDILIRPEHLEYALQLVEQFPEQRFVIDHMAKPAIKNNEITQWQHDIKLLAGHNNVYCKISGLVTEADWHSWTIQDLEPYLGIVFAAFGPNRVMYGSDWPVCNLAGGYNLFFETMNTYTANFSTADQELFWAGNATTFYKLNEDN
ncbi:amidohydrolase family protein [Mucilaginibacter sp. X4EP1]|uniref:amidohydrolase family protein n=1 Tax=Mucilaginibacter sp. X4EP1 TaxID=2723092 RepID=UPI00216834FB|nr:amidohydrolase family protein [Mucilaginibacter sp. X4EP1]MCS3812474.1 L-fuconolactonase [Mucilaginibacter sp. X4EP1]